MYKDIINEAIGDLNENEFDNYTKEDYQQIINDFNSKYNLQKDDELDNKIIELLASNFKCLNKYKILMMDDMENCFNCTQRKQLLDNIYNTIPSLYNLNYSVCAYPTKMIIQMEDGNKIIDYQMDGGQQGNSLTMIQLIINEATINEKLQEVAKVLKSDFKLDIMKCYADDQNKGGNIKDCILHYYLKEKLAKEYGGKYNNDKTYIVISSKSELDHQTLTYLNKNNISIQENNTYKILKAKRGDNSFDDKMCKYIKNIIDKVNIASKLKNNYQKMKLFINV